MTANFDGRNADQIGITGYALASCVGTGRGAHLDAIRSGRSGLTPCAYPDLPFDCYVGHVAGLESMQFPAGISDFDNRANRLALSALQSDGFLEAAGKMRERWGADRCGVILGTSTDDYVMSHNDNHQAVAAFTQKYLGLSGPSYTISTACSSSAKALIDATQLIEAGFCDAVVVGGVDTLCLISLNGFEAMQLVSREPCRPCDAGRNGLSIGEAAGFLIVERDHAHCIRLSGMGESSDGVSMSTPPTDGAGAAVAMRAALAGAGIDPGQIGYVNLHGTATPTNDTAECAAVSNVFGSDTPASSLKGMLGHTLGAAGAVEAIMCIIALEENLIPGNTGLGELDPDISCDIVAHTRPAELSHVVSNAFGFGGSNCALLFSQ